MCVKDWYFNSPRVWVCIKAILHDFCENLYLPKFNRICYRVYTNHAVENARWNGWKQYLLGIMSNFGPFCSKWRALLVRGSCNIPLTLIKRCDFKKTGDRTITKSLMMSTLFFNINVGPLGYVRNSLKHWSFYTCMYTCVLCISKTTLCC